MHVYLCEFVCKNGHIIIIVIAGGKGQREDNNGDAHAERVARIRQHTAVMFTMMRDYFLSRFHSKFSGMFNYISSLYESYN